VSTRGFVTLVIDGREKTVFNHYDSYPDGLGESVLAWLRDGAVNFPDLLIERARALQMLPRSTEDEVAHAQTEVDARRAVYNLDNLAHLLEVGVAVDDSAFPLESFWAEWGYVIDLDAQRLEVYRGFQTAPHASGRFADRMLAQPHRVLGKLYYPVALVTGWPFSALPTNDEFTEEVYRLTREEDEGDDDA
jgi:hypothetical protein